jgi:NAD(P)-dependent dehydrogenase (short-subunit alcohol dehydrogenase family)
MSNERITTDFNATSTAADVIKGIELDGHRAIVTGGASGIGIETARALAGAGAEVTLAVRDLDAGARTARELTRDTGNERVLVAKLDLADQESVAAFVADWSGPLDLLINNAGVMASPLSRTSQGWESQFATNHFGHFALATGLHDALAAAEGSRVVSLSSVAHLNSGIDFDDIHFDRRDYDPALAYAQSKTANVLFAVEATKRWADEGITVNAVHPGAILATSLTRHYDPQVLDDLVASGRYTFKTPEQGAATSILVATSPLLDGIGGRYFEDANEALPYDPNLEHRGVAAHALDPEAAARLWDVSAAATRRDS